MRTHQFLVSRDFGGGELVALEIAKWGKNYGLATDIWVPGTGPTADAVRDAALRWCPYDLNAIRTRILGRTWTWLALGARLRGIGGVAHIHAPGAYRLLLPALRIGGVRTVVHVHLDSAPDELRWAFKSPPDLIITCARYMVSSLRNALGDYADKLPVVAVPNAVDTKRFYPGDRAMAKERVAAPLDRPLALMMANLAPHKGQETAIRAVAAMKARGRDIECWLAGVERAGQRDYQRRLEALAVDLGVAGRVRLLGQRSDGPDLLRAADFFLLPSTREGLPLSILEAQATKTPVLAAPTAGVPEVVREGKTGFLISAGDAIGYAERMIDLLGNPEQYHQVTQGAYANVTRNHSSAAFCERVYTLYQEVLDGRQTSGRGFMGQGSDDRQRGPGLCPRCNGEAAEPGAGSDDSCQADCH